jgi:hypothetical protein
MQIIGVIDVGPLHFDEGERLALQHPRASGRRLGRAIRSGAGQIAAI